ncbi:CUE domain-containing protein 5 [Yarrowia sp. C11]|nr:CUE domain-containing protein 5 [Yarrowia sp. E02]KAG5369027.1 CUE domain-containing protein 5 [Yarrowia sp. C11]
MAKKNSKNNELKEVDPNPEVEVEDLEDKVKDLKVDDKETSKDIKDDKEDKKEEEDDKTTTVKTETEETDKDGDDKKTETITTTEVDKKTTTEEESAPSYQQPYTPKLSQNESQPPTPPPKPPRPLSPFSQAQAHLKEAFPDTEDSVIKAVLVASGGEVEPAFTALLSMSDPNFKPDIPPRQQQQRPIGGPGSDASMAHKIHSPRSQIEADERLARQLAGQYDRRTANRTGGVPARYRGSTESNRSYSGRYDERRDNREEDDQGFFQSEDWQDFSNQVVQGFNETKNKVNSWVKNLSNKIDGVESDERQYRDYEEYGDDYYEPRRQQRPAPAPRSESTRGLVGALGSGRESQESQRSYQEFYSSKTSRSKTRVNDDGEFRTISLKNNDLDDDDKPLMPPRPPAKDALAGATAAVNKAESNKWEPLKAVEPQPEEEKDPFFIGDSDDEDDKEEATKKEVKEEVKVTEDKD